MSAILGSWVDGAPATAVPLDDRGLQYGDGLFETLRVRRGQARFLDAHLARLATGLARLAIPAPDVAALRAELAAAAAATREDAILKLIVTRGSGPRGYAARGAFTPRRILTLHASPAPVFPGDGVALRIARLALADNPALAGLKHLNRLDNVLAASEPEHEHCFDSLLLDSSGQVVSGTLCNVFLVHQGQLVTPSVERVGVAGVMRGIVLRECGRLGLSCEVRAVPAAELWSADELFVTNARIGVVPVLRLGEHVWTVNHASRIATHVEALDA